MFIVIPSLEGWSTMAKEAPSPHEVRRWTPLDTYVPVSVCLSYSYELIFTGILAFIMINHIIPLKQTQLFFCQNFSFWVLFNFCLIFRNFSQVLLIKSVAYKKACSLNQQCMTFWFSCYITKGTRQHKTLGGRKEWQECQLRFLLQWIALF